jgi:hypothetical protein
VKNPLRRPPPKLNPRLQLHPRPHLLPMQQNPLTQLRLPQPMHPKTLRKRMLLLLPLRLPQIK